MGNSVSSRKVPCPLFTSLLNESGFVGIEHVSRSQIEASFYQIKLASLERLSPRLVKEERYTCWPLGP